MKIVLCDSLTGVSNGIIFDVDLTDGMIKHHSIYYFEAKAFESNLRKTKMIMGIGTLRDTFYELSKIVQAELFQCHKNGQFESIY